MVLASGVSAGRATGSPARPVAGPSRSQRPATSPGRRVDTSGCGHSVIARARAPGPSAAPSKASLGRASLGDSRSTAVAGGGGGPRGDVAPPPRAILASSARAPGSPTDPFSLLQQQRIVFIGGEINEITTEAAINQLMLLDSEDSAKPIKLFINSPGGSVTAGMGLYDAMQLCQCPVETYCFGLAASMGAFLLGAGTPGRRYALPNARIMIHQPLGGFGGRAAEVEVQTNEIMFHKANLNRIMSGYTGQSIERIEADTDRDFYMSPVEAVKYGMIDRVIGGEDAGVKITEGARRDRGVRGVGLRAPGETSKPGEEADEAEPT